MLVAGIVILLFHKLKQPVVLGYLAAGILIGPHLSFPSVLSIHDNNTISILGELGVVFLMFSLGLEFSLKKIAKVGASAFIAAICETSLMIFIGYRIGQYFHWSNMDCLFLGAMLAISSTTIIVKALGELGLKQNKFAQMIFGMLIVEDILAIGIIALLSGIATSGTITSDNIVTTLGQLSLFIIVTMVLGLLTIPRLLGYIAKSKSHEMMLISVLGLCFGVCLLVIALNYSIALGAFMIGAIIAEARPLHLIETLIEPLRDMFCAIFFVTIGMMFDPNILINYYGPIFIISLVLIIGKVTGCTIGAFITGKDGKTSLKVGMSMAQIGEFSFIIAALGASSKVTSNLLYPIAIAVSAITTLSTPYLIKLSDPLSSLFSKKAPRRLLKIIHGYTKTIDNLHPQGDGALILKIVGKIIAQIIVNCALVAAIFIASVFVTSHIDILFTTINGEIVHQQLYKTIVCGLSIFISLPFLVATYRKLKAFSMILAEIIIRDNFFGQYNYNGRRIVFELLPLIAISLIMSLIFSLSSPILPQINYLLSLVIVFVLLAIVFRKPLIRFQSWLQIELFSVMEDKNLNN